MKRFLLLSGLHFTCFALLFLASLDFSAVDGGDPALASRLAGLCVGILGQPGIALHRALGPGLSGAFEWGVTILNSLLWGALLGALLGRLRPNAART